MSKKKTEPPPMTITAKKGKVELTIRADLQAAVMLDELGLWPKYKLPWSVRPNGGLPKDPPNHHKKPPDEL